MICNDYGDYLLNDTTTSLNVDDVLKALRSQFEQTLLETPIYVGNTPVSLSKSHTGNNGWRYWFVCPTCGTRVAKLFTQNSLAACRHCTGIKYRSSRYKGMVEGSLNEGLER
jgi:DNA-directed RNA polymerase subunit RPC12/RpoP